MIDKEITTLKGISERFDIPIWTLRKWASERKFPGIIKLGRSVKVDIPIFRQWVNSHRVDKPEGAGR